MLISKTLIIKWRPQIKKYYENKGYKFTKWNDKFEIKIKDLSKGSHVLVEVKCDCEDCENPYLKPMTWQNYLKHLHNDGKYYCNKCGTQLFGTEKAIATKLKNSKSFEQWCVDNNRQDVLDRWDYELNKCSPSEIGYATSKKFWLKCPIEIHKSEIQDISHFTSGNEGSIKCKACNSFAQWGIDKYGEDFLKKYWGEENTLNPWKISHCSRNEILIKCQDKLYHGSHKTLCLGFVNGDGCPYCNSFASGKVHPLDSLGKLLEEKGLLYLWSDKNGSKSPYEYAPNSHSKVWWKCPEGKHEDYYRDINSSNTMCNFHCFECQRSKGEKRIEEYLIRNNFIENKNYIVQKEFKGLVGLKNGNLSYDFYLLKPFNLLIEYQGEQHEKPIDFKGKGKKYANEQFIKQQEHDRRKKQYAINNKINLFEIWYWDYDNIEKILDKEFLKYNIQINKFEKAI